MSRAAIRTHGDLELLVRGEADRHGWSSEVSNIDVDPQELTLAGKPRPCPGRGDVVLSSENATVPFEYHLPEDPDDILCTVRNIIRADKIERDRRANPDRYNRPIEVM